LRAQFEDSIINTYVESLLGMIEKDDCKVSLSEGSVKVEVQIAPSKPTVVYSVHSSLVADPVAVAANLVANVNAVADLPTSGRIAITGMESIIVGTHTWQPTVSPTLVPTSASDEDYLNDSSVNESSQTTTTMPPPAIAAADQLLTSTEAPRMPGQRVASAAGATAANVSLIILILLAASCCCLGGLIAFSRKLRRSSSSNSSHAMATQCGSGAEESPQMKGSKWSNDNPEAADGSASAKIARRLEGGEAPLPLQSSAAAASETLTYSYF
jgi:hypothetical protein